MAASAFNRGFAKAGMAMVMATVMAMVTVHPIPPKPHPVYAPAIMDTSRMAWEAVNWPIREPSVRPTHQRIFSGIVNATQAIPGMRRGTAASKTRSPVMMCVNPLATTVTEFVMSSAISLIQIATAQHRRTTPLLQTTHPLQMTVRAGRAT